MFTAFRTGSRWARGIAAGLFFALAPLPWCTARPPESRQVSLYLTVEQGDKLVGGLREQNFRLYEDGKSRLFKLAEPEKPATIVLLVEYSRSSWMYFDDIAQAMQGFAREAPEGNWYALVTFAHEPTIQVDFTKMKGKITAAFSDLGSPIWSEIDTYDAVHDTLSRLDRLPGRRVLILIGSGYDTFSSHTLDDVQKQIESTNAVVFSLGAGSLLRGRYDPYVGTSARTNLLQAETFMKMLAAKSGGQAWFPRFAQAFPDVMKGIMQMLEFQYRLVYESQVPADGKLHVIKVEAFQIVNDQREDYKVRVREGWRR